MGDRFRHVRHVFRVGVVLGVGLVAFLIARAAAIPSDFGVLGFYRAGALDDNRALPIVYAGRTACLECHDGTYDPPAPETTASDKALAVRPSRSRQGQQALPAELRGLSRTSPETRGRRGQGAGAEGRLRRPVPQLSQQSVRPAEVPAASRAGGARERVVTNERRVRRLPQAALAEDRRRQTPVTTGARPWIRIAAHSCTTRASSSS